MTKQDALEQAKLLIEGSFKKILTKGCGWDSDSREQEVQRVLLEDITPVLGDLSTFKPVHPDDDRTPLELALSEIRVTFAEAYGSNALAKSLVKLITEYHKM